ncbi:hypothetical protein [Rubrolithibacter danxiaensis]|uniref:hypothetical protein n=1 Tax=Rubrolithibacter danxiaensis TaxID=3390805 RepID=UPI003BF866B7
MELCGLKLRLSLDFFPLFYQEKRGSLPGDEGIKNTTVKISLEISIVSLTYLPPHTKPFKAFLLLFPFCLDTKGAKNQGLTVLAKSLNKGLSASQAVGMAKRNVSHYSTSPPCFPSCKSNVSARLHSNFLNAKDCNAGYPF